MGAIRTKNCTLKVVCDNKIPFLPNSGELPNVELICLPAAQITPATVHNVDAIITRTRTRCDAQLLEKSSVKFIATATIGFDHIDVEYLNSRNIIWRNAPGCNAVAVAQYVISSLANIGFAENGERYTLGIVGAGNVGSEVERMAKILGFKVLLNDPPREKLEGAAKFTPLDELLRKSDVVTLHVPANETTLNMANAAFFARMKGGAVFINTSRGDVADEVALQHADGLTRIIDVWRNEPEIDLSLFSLLRFGTPHIAGYSTDGKANATAMAFAALCDFFDIREAEACKIKKLPPPSVAMIELPEHDQLRAAILHSYDVSEDDMNLRRDARNFEQLRGDYRVRREFKAFTVRNASQINAPILSKLGFNIEG